MDNLHLSYAEVTDVIPYRYLLLMARDKQHIAYGDVFEEVDEAEFFKRMGSNNPFAKTNNVKQGNKEVK